MTLKHYIKENGNGAYCIGEDTDALYDSNTCIDVDPRPTNNHIWNNTISQWELSEEIYMIDLRAKRDAELIRTDKFMLEDYPISVEDKATALTYRQALRDCPHAALLADRVMPVCPAALQ